MLEADFVIGVRKGGFEGLCQLQIMKNLEVLLHVCFILSAILPRFLILYAFLLYYLFLLRVGYSFESGRREAGRIEKHSVHTVDCEKHPLLSNTLVDEREMGVFVLVFRVDVTLIVQSLGVYCLFQEGHLC